ncbi:DNA-binding protein [Streptococcus sp. zg-86]|uniref:DNA-binding protein n=1 Tax=Streptococcus zhangguiae TaxID=2664091 RepID=A0A6I4R8F9_9STRE|nr:MULTISPECIES: DNA-binding protein [unclassified Streptococcus]MTB63847.1 DNA-binding protein [Streptococcus sp. zg-86]MTB90157.1 DNA-binding protein [Streptococcus sp. zg-36]MWV55829.1 DNA-binding protein [Streptococcus sp. zg-70]QTH47889.1 DNA-binding protein [Streptococcus sp. zg-86]
MTENTFPSNYRRVLELIPRGSERPITNREIQRITGLSERAIREIVQRLTVRYKIPIGNVRGNSAGYYFPTNDAERFQGMIELDKQVTEEHKRLEVIKYGNLNEQDKYLKGG